MCSCATFTDLWCLISFKSEYTFSVLSSLALSTSLFLPLWWVKCTCVVNGVPIICTLASHLFHTGCHRNSKMRPRWAGIAKTLHSSAATPETSLCPLATDFRIDWKTMECLTRTGLPPLVRITVRDTAVGWHPGEVMPLALSRCHETSLLHSPIQAHWQPQLYIPRNGFTLQ